MDNIPTQQKAACASSKRNVDAKCLSVVTTILERCKKEQDIGCLQVPIFNYIERVSFYTGLPSMYISELDQGADSTPVKPPTVIDFTIILKCLKQFYLNEKFPTLNETFKAVQQFRLENNCDNINYDQFCRHLMCLHFYERPTSNGRLLLMEDPKCTFERYNYLKKIQKCRDKNMHIYYLDQREFWKSAALETTQLYFAVLRHLGYVRGLFLTNPIKDDYVRWITDILLPHLTHGLVILSHGPFDEALTSINITRYHSKAEMLAWLKANDIPCSSDMHKAELYELISKSCLKCEQSSIERVLKANGHEVLYRPSSLKDSTPTELFWCEMKSKLKDSFENDKLTKLKNNVQFYIKTVSRLKWVEYDDSIEENEKIILKEDQQIGEALEKYQFNVVACEKFSDRKDYSAVLDTSYLM